MQDKEKDNEQYSVESDDDKAFTIKAIAIIAVIVIIIIAFIAFTAPNKKSKSTPKNSEKQYVKTAERLQKAIDEVEYVLAQEQETTGMTVQKYKKDSDLAKMFVRHLDVSSIQNFFYNSVITTRFTPNERYMYKLERYADMPIIQTANLNMYIILKFEQGCKIVDLNEMQNSSCIVLVDLNGINKPNNYGTTFDDTDRYAIIIDGKTNKALINGYYAKELKKTLAQ